MGSAGVEVVLHTTNESVEISPRNEGVDDAIVATVVEFVLFEPAAHQIAAVVGHGERTGHGQPGALARPDRIRLEQQLLLWVHLPVAVAARVLLWQRREDLRVFPSGNATGKPPEAGNFCDAGI